MQHNNYDFLKSEMTMIDNQNLIMNFYSWWWRMIMH